MVTFYVLAAIYSVAGPARTSSRRWPRTSARDEGTFGLIAAGFMIICVAPFAEEFFFRGFFYGALRTRFSVGVAAADRRRWCSALIHFDCAATDALLILPPLAVLGFIFCLVYERTGSLYPVIAMHSINNSIAYGAQADGWAVSAVLGPLMLLACVLVPRLQRRPPALR